MLYAAVIAAALLQQVRLQALSAGPAWCMLPAVQCLLMPAATLVLRLCVAPVALSCAAASRIFADHGAQNLALCSIV